MERPTVTSLARQLGVSRQTISNALNRPERLAPATRSRVLDAIHRSGYVPSVAARQLRTERSRALALRLLPSFDGINGHILELFSHGLAERAREHERRLAVFSAHDVEDEIAQYSRLFKSREIDGVVLTSSVEADPRVGWLATHGYPFVSFGRPWGDSRARHSWVDVDGAAGTRAVTRKLLDRGYRAIAYISWPLHPGVAADRFRGWADAMDAAGGPGADPELVRYCPDEVTAGRAVAADLVARGAEAIVCASDTLALGAIPALLDQYAPHEVANRLVGFDDTPVARAIGLSSVQQPVAEAAATAFDLLIEQLDGHEEFRQVLLTPTPIFRDEDRGTLLAGRTDESRYQS